MGMAPSIGAKRARFLGILEGGNPLPPLNRGIFRQNRPKGMTLIELLIAMAIAVLLAGLVFSVYRTVLNTIRTQTLWRDSLSPAVAALDALNRDFTCSLIPLGLTNAPFVLDTETNGLTAVRLCFATAETASSGDRKDYDIVHVQYLLRSASGPSGYSLVRQCWPLRAPSGDAGSPGEEVVVKDLDRFQIELFDGNQWTNRWGTESAESIPEAARVRISFSDEAGTRILESEILIPAGHRIPAQNE